MSLNKKTRIIFAIWRGPLAHAKATSAEADKILNLQEITFNITKHFLILRSAQHHKFIQDYSLTRILHESFDNGHDWCVVLSSGNIILPNFLQGVESFCERADPSTPFFGHILDRKNRRFGFHQQFFIVNLNAWNKLGRPNAGTPSELLIDIREPIPITKNIHDDYTPVCLKGSEEFVEIRPGVFGWNWINSALKANLIVENIPSILRSSKIFLYPEQNSVDLLGALKLEGEYLAESHDNLNEDQIKALHFLSLESPQRGQKIFPINTESYMDIERLDQAKELGHLFSVASGFKDLFILGKHGYTAKTKITYFDINPLALKFKKYIYKNWSGRDFDAFYRKCVSELPSELKNSRLVVSKEEIKALWERELYQWGGAEKFEKVFRDAQQMDISFVEVDILKRPLKLIDLIEKTAAKELALWHSNCFNFTPTLISLNWRMEDLQRYGRNFLYTLYRAAEGKNLNLYGEDVVLGAKFSNVSNRVSEIFF